jgi:hypothetical protein
MKRQMSKTQKEPEARDWWNLGLNTITGNKVNERPNELCQDDKNKYEKARRLKLNN